MSFNRSYGIITLSTLFSLSAAFADDQKKATNQQTAAEQQKTQEQKNANEKRREEQELLNPLKHELQQFVACGLGLPASSALTTNISALQELNPAYLTRQLREKVRARYQREGHIVSCSDHTARLFREGRMYKIRTDKIKAEGKVVIKDPLQISICPSGEYDSCETECADDRYKLFKDGNGDGYFDFAQVQPGPRPWKDPLYLPPRDKSIKGKRQMQNQYEQELLKIARCYGIIT